MNKYTVIERILNEKYGEYFHIFYHSNIGYYLVTTKLVKTKLPNVLSYDEFRNEIKLFLPPIYIMKLK